MTDLNTLLASEPKFRRKQILDAWFDPKLNDFSSISTLPLALREKLKNEPWLSVTMKTMQESKVDYTVKALLQLNDGYYIESVLMGRVNKKEDKKTEFRYTICVSTQVGCAMGCTFCGTGTMGFKRNLASQEIVDQYRYWQKFLYAKDNTITKPIDNIVLMGQGEPLLNYDAVKDALNTILAHTEIGPRQITLSTVGVPSAMERMLNDEEFPAVRFALSLHNAIEDDRKKLIPSHQPHFFEFLIGWSAKFHEKYPGRTHFIGIEYTVVKNENDSEKHLKALIKLASKLGKVRINLIPCNEAGKKTTTSEIAVIEAWQQRLMECGFTCTIRRSQGQDIAAACGQLANKF